MVKNILTDRQLKAKLVNYNFVFTNDEFEELKYLGFYHVFNSFVSDKARKNGKQKRLSDYIKLYKLDFQLKSILFPMILDLENVFKQRLNDTMVEEIMNNSSTSSHYNEVVKYCIKKTQNVEAKKILFKSCSHKNQIVSHYFDNHNDIPIWAYFELLDLGSFLSLLNKTTDKDDEPKGNHKIKEKFNRNCHFVQSNGNEFSSNAKAKYIYDSLRFIKSVRNNIAHNQPIIDSRFAANENFKKRALNLTVKELGTKIGLHFTSDLTDKYNFESATDTISIIYIMHLFMFGETNQVNISCKNFIQEEIKENKSQVADNIHSKIFGKNNLQKANFLLST